MVTGRKVPVAFIGAGIVAEMHGRGVRACSQAKLAGEDLFILPEGGMVWKAGNDK